MKLFYRESNPSADISHLVFSFWEFRTGEFEGVYQHEVFPDGCVSLFYRRSSRPELSTLAFNGLHLEAITAPVLKNELFWGMRVSPAACARLVSADPQMFRRNRTIRADVFPHLTSNLFDRISACGSFEEAIGVFEERLRLVDLPPSEIDEKVAKAVELIEASGGEVRIGTLAKEVGISPRQLERRFKSCSGLTPKQFARTRRVRAVAVHLIENETINWAERAAETGFADQSHLSREFSAVTGRTPNSFADRVVGITHGNFVKKD